MNIAAPIRKPKGKIPMSTCTACQAKGIAWDTATEDGRCYHRYPVNVFWSDEDEGFVATVSDLPGCSAFGETKFEAISEIEKAIEAWIEAANAAGNPISEPSRPTLDASPSGKL
jgi:predicted RNase H-like HicB family nuclease